VVSSPIVGGRGAWGSEGGIDSPFMLAQHPGRGPAAVDAQLAAGAFHQGVGARLGDPHQRADLLGKPVFADQAQGFALAFGQKFEAGGGIGRRVHGGGERIGSTRSRDEVRCGAGRPRR